MEPLLGAKISSLFALLIITLICGLIPIWFKWSQIEATRASCAAFSAGVFLGAGFMHMTAEALKGTESEGHKLPLRNKTESEGAANSADMDYPYGELIISLGFFLIFLLESLALQCCPGASGGSKVHEEEVGAAHVLGLHSHGSRPLPSRSPFRVLVLLLSLSFHSVFEGMAVGLQTTVVATVQLCLAVLAHKGLVVFGIGLRLVQTGTALRWAALCILTFALMSPLGLILGLAVAGGDSEEGNLAQAVLGGVSVGTFLYVTFLEILPKELSGSESPLVMWCCVVGGFTFMAFIALWA
uniref:Solute carrier family 39 member 2 n=1 Tax=Molossus molossus TaxID=27622 RepID=A0A7J8K0H9_MOLMO|nr:solute carrier family 39 member 2 [Molossus molossus]